MISKKLNDYEKACLLKKIEWNKNLIQVEKNMYESGFRTEEQYKNGLAYYQREIDTWEDELRTGDFKGYY